MPGSDLALLLDAARASGEIARRFWGKSPQTWDKGDAAGPVTEADLAIDRMLHSELLSARPDYGWLSEETEDDTRRLNTARQFIVDPIDGTRAFIAGEKSFAHSIAIAENGEVVAGVVLLPMLDLIYAGEAGKGATLNGEPIAASAAHLEGATVLGARPNFAAEHWLGDQAPPVARAFRPSLAYRLCLVANGRFDAMITLRDTWEWDVAAGSLIAAEAGATVTDARNGAPRFNHPVPRLPGMLAGGPQLHTALIHRLKPR